MTYDTGNPLGSEDPKDLFDNSRNLDHYLNAEALDWQDRFGKERKTWAGVEEQARLDTEAAAGAAAALATEQAGEFKDAAEAARDTATDASQSAASARDDAIAAAAASGDVEFAKDIADMQSKLPLPNDTIIEVAKDGNHSDARTRYVVKAGVPEFMVALESFVQAGAGSVQMSLQQKSRQTVTSADKGVVGSGADETSALAATVETGASARFLPATVKVTGPVRAGGKRLTFDPGFRVYADPTAPALAHEQIIPSVILPDAYTPYDYARFGRMDPVIMAYGDSNTAWVDASSARIGVGQGSWPALLDAYLSKHTYFAAGRVRGDGSPGQESQYALDNLDTFLATYSPQVAILGWGTNDIAHGVTREKYLANMALLIERLHQAGICVIVLGIPWHTSYANEVKAWNSSLARLSAQYGVDFVPVYTAFANAVGTYFAADGVHYTVVANQVLAQILGDLVLKRYSIPKNTMAAFYPRPGSSLDPTTWACEGIRSSGGKKLQIVQTPDVYLRRLYPYSIKIDAGQEVSISGTGPFSAVFNWPDSKDATWTLNGGAYNPISRGGVVKVNSTSARLDGSSSSFRVGCSTGSIYLVATHAEFGFAAPIYSTTEIRNGVYVPGRRITVADATHHLDTVMIEIAGTVDIGYATELHLPNVGPLATRQAIVNAPIGFKFMQSDNETWWRWDGAWQAY